MQKITVPEKYNEKNLNNFILDKFPNLNINMLYKALRQKDIKINGKRVKENVVIHEGEKIEYTDYTVPITDTIKLEDNIKQRKIRIYVAWNDEKDTEIMDNKADTDSTLKQENSAIFNVKVAFSQVI